MYKFICEIMILEQLHNFMIMCISRNKLTGSRPIICASWNSLLRMKFLPSVAVTLDMTDVLSRSMVWYRGSGRSPVNLKMVIHNACAACNVKSWFTRMFIFLVYFRLYEAFPGRPLKHPLDGVQIETETGHMGLISWWNMTTIKPFNNLTHFLT
jgi:hypothetical protein